MISRPMLAASVDESQIDQLPYPMVASPKLDGIRCIVQGGRALSRKFIDIPNRYIQAQLGRLPDLRRWGLSLDGELMLRSRKASFQSVKSAVMSRDGDPDFVYWIFDLVGKDPLQPYAQRLRELRRTVKELPAYVRAVPTQRVAGVDDLMSFESRMLVAGFEGVCMRAPDSPYKFGRATLRQAWLLKFKRFADSEAEIVGFVEARHNANVATRDFLGRVKRSSAKAGRIRTDTLGALVLRDPKIGETFACGTGPGLTAQLRQEIWDRRADLIGALVKYRYQRVGVADRPSFLGFRDRRDL